MEGMRIAKKKKIRVDRIHIGWGSLKIGNNFFSTYVNESTMGLKAHYRRAHKVKKFN